MSLIFATFERFLYLYSIKIREIEKYINHTFKIITMKTLSRAQRNEAEHIFYMLGFNDYGHLAQHWSDFPKGITSLYIDWDDAFNWDDLKEELKDNGITAELAIIRNKAGENHYSHISSLNSKEDFEKYIEERFLQPHYFYKDKETEEENFLEEIAKADSIDEVKELIKKFENFEEGFYDCDGNFHVESGDYETSFLEDVYIYKLAIYITDVEINEKKLEL